MQKLLTQFKTEIVAKYLIAAILIIVPLYPKFPFINIPGTYVAIRFEDILLLALGILTGFSILTNFRKFMGDKIFRSFMLFFAIGAVSLFSATFVTKTVEFHLGLLHLLRRVEYVMPFFAILILFKKGSISKSLNYYLGIVLIVIGILFVYGLGQKYYSFPIIITQNQEYSKGVALRFTPGSHINSTFAGHYDLASYMVFILPILISLFFILKDRLSKTVIFIVVICGLWLLVNSLSRIAQVSYLVSAGTSLLLLKKYKEIILIFAISLIFILSSSGLYQRFSRFFTVYAAEEEVEIFEDRSTNIRLAVEWPRAIRSITKSPLLGTGYSSVGLATDNDYLRVLAETGLLGLLAFVLLFKNILSEIFKGFFYHKKFNGIELGIMVGVVGGVIGTFLTATFIDIFEASKFAITYWLFVGIAVYLVRNNINEQKN